MSRELELAGLGSVGGWLRWRRRHVEASLGSPCKTCDTPLQGPYCHACGQLAENFHKSVGHLVVEVFESFFHFDGRLFRTLPALLLRPHRLTLEYLDGRRALQIPPLRLFLVVLLLVFFFGSLGGDKTSLVHFDERPDAARVGAPASGKGIRPPSGTFGLTVTDATAPKAGAVDHSVKATSGNGLGRWLDERFRKAAEHPDEFRAVLGEWAHRLAIVMLPISAVLLSLLFAFQRRFFVYDHLIFSMHSLSFVGLLFCLYLPFKILAGPAAGVVLLAAPLHLFVHMRGVYGTSVFSTLLRMALLFVGSMIGFAGLLFGLVLIGLNAMSAH